MTAHRWAWFGVGWLTGLVAVLVAAGGAYTWGYRTFWRSGR